MDQVARAAHQEEAQQNDDGQVALSPWQLARNHFEASLLKFANEQREEKVFLFDSFILLALGHYPECLATMENILLKHGATGICFALDQLDLLLQYAPPGIDDGFMRTLPAFRDYLMHHPVIQDVLLCDVNATAMCHMSDIFVPMPQP
jgi:hypothetical protein